MQIKTINVHELAKLEERQQIDLIDVRTPAEFRAIHVKAARNVPLDRLDPAEIMRARNGLAGEPLYVICKSGMRGAKACEKFAGAGFENVINVDGGTEAWYQAGHPVTRGKATISLERQVRIVAGLIIFVTGLLAIFVHPYFAGVAAFVGAGLTWAGITDSCAMAMILARMPWNQVKEGPNV